MEDRLKEKCGIVGIWSKEAEVARTAYFGLFALQHRGQEQSGIATSDGKNIHSYIGSGLVSQVYTEEKIASLTGHAAIGHNRYSTSRGTDASHGQPVTTHDIVTLAHNGNLPSVTALENFVREHDMNPENRSDSELMADAIALYMREGKSMSEAIKAAFPLFTGVYSVVVLDSHGTLAAFRDPFGMRPLSLGTISGGYVVASETCALRTMGATFVRDVEPGELLVIGENGLTSMILAPATPKFDIFEFVYFARHDSTIMGRSVYQARRNTGQELAKEALVEADIVVPVPETSIPAAIGYAEVRGIPLELALNKNRYIHRTFIEPHQDNREQKVRMKLSTLDEVIHDKRVAVIDDSIVRGTTSKQIVKMLFDAGAKEVHFLVVSPPVKFPDFYGIDTPIKEDLIANTMSQEEICKHLGADFLGYLTIPSLIKVSGATKKEFCLACFNGEYPVQVPEEMSKLKLEFNLKSPA
jgi:amidophosphoribosyltransferase